MQEIHLAYLAYNEITVIQEASFVLQVVNHLATRNDTRESLKTENVSTATHLHKKKTLLVPDT